MILLQTPLLLKPVAQDLQQVIVLIFFKSSVEKKSSRLDGTTLTIYDSLNVKVHDITVDTKVSKCNYNGGVWFWVGGVQRSASEVNS